MTRTKAESAHLQRIKEMPCGVCGAAPPSDAHHIRQGQGMSQRASDYLTVPLCKACHQGQNGIHGDKALWRIYHEDEMSVLAATIGRMTA